MIIFGKINVAFLLAVINIRIVIANITKAIIKLNKNGRKVKDGARGCLVSVRFRRKWKGFARGS